VGVAERSSDLVVFDIDGTLIVHENGEVVWQTLQRRYGTPRAVAAARRRDYEAGRISYADWVRLDVSDWRAAGATRDHMAEGLRAFALRPGARALLFGLQRRGYRLAAVSGTLDLRLDTILPDHPFEGLYCNRLAYDRDGALAGGVATPYDFEGKAQALRQLAADLLLPLSRVAFVGDDVNDVPAARAGGFSAAVHPRSEALVEVADVVVRDGSLERLLEWFP